MKYGELVTIGLKAYNQCATIRAALDGVLSQTYRPLEVVISDDGSTDGTWEIIQETVATAMDRKQDGFSIVLNRNAQNLGNMGNWLRICELSHGEWIVKCDGDDISDPNRVETIVHGIVESENAGKQIRVVSNGGVKINGEGRELGRFAARSAWYPLGACMSFHRDCFVRFPRPENGHNVDDEIFARRALMLGGEFKVDRPLVRYRLGSGISSDTSNVREAELRCMRQFTESLRQCRIDLECVRSEIGEDEYADWRKRLEYEEQQHSAGVTLRTATSFRERFHAFRMVERSTWRTLYWWKLGLYLLPKSIGDLMLRSASWLRYGAGGALSGGILWSSVEKGMVYGLNFVQGIILARLLSPEDFGLAAMLGIFITVGGVLAESGLTGGLVVFGCGPSLRRLERHALWWNVGLATLIFGLLSAGAPLIAAWYEHSVLAPLVCVMALGIVINSTSVVATARLWRSQRFDRMFWVNGSGALAGMGLACALAWLGCGVWSIAGMGICQAAVRASLAWWMSCGCAGEIREEAKESPSFRRVLGYGLKTTLSGIIHATYLESYNLIIGKVMTPSAVGLFVRGDRWARLPGDITSDIVGRVAMPILTRAGSSKCGEIFCLCSVNILMQWPVLAILWICAEDVVGFVFGPQWVECVPYLRIMLFGQLLVPISNMALQVIRSSGHAEILLKTDAWKKPIGVLAIFLAIPFGIVGLCWAKVVNDIVEMIVDVVYASRCGIGVKV